MKPIVTSVFTVIFSLTSIAFPTPTYPRANPEEVEQIGREVIRTARPVFQLIRSNSAGIGAAAGGAAGAAVMGIPVGTLAIGAVAIIGFEAAIFALGGATRRAVYKYIEDQHRKKMWHLLSNPTEITKTMEECRAGKRACYYALQADGNFVPYIPNSGALGRGSSHKKTNESVVYIDPARLEDLVMQRSSSLRTPILPLPANPTAEEFQRYFRSVNFSSRRSAFDISVVQNSDGAQPQFHGFEITEAVIIKARRKKLNEAELIAALQFLQRISGFVEGEESTWKAMEEAVGSDIFPINGLRTWSTILAYSHFIAAELYTLDDYVGVVEVVRRMYRELATYISKCGNGEIVHWIQTHSRKDRGYTQVLAYFELSNPLFDAWKELMAQGFVVSFPYAALHPDAEITRTVSYLRQEGLFPSKVSVEVGPLASDQNNVDHLSLRMNLLWNLMNTLLMMPEPLRVSIQSWSAEKLYTVEIRLFYSKVVPHMVFRIEDSFTLPVEGETIPLGLARNVEIETIPTRDGSIALWRFSEPRAFWWTRPE